MSYHINPDTGRPNLCKADPSNPNSRGCPYKKEDGDPAIHYSSKEEARTAYEKENNSKTFNNLKNNSDTRGKRKKLAEEKKSKDLAAKKRKEEIQNNSLDSTSGCGQESGCGGRSSGGCGSSGGGC